MFRRNGHSTTARTFSRRRRHSRHRVERRHIVHRPLRVLRRRLHLARHLRRPIMGSGCCRHKVRLVGCQPKIHLREVLEMLPHTPSSKSAESLVYQHTSVKKVPPELR